MHQLVHREHLPAIRARTPVLLWLFSCCLVSIGLVTAAGGLYLVSLGGSTYYVIFGGLSVVSGYLVFHRQRSSAWVYLAALVFTIVWAFSEIGPEFWLLLPRLDGPIVLGSIFLIPRIFADELADIPGVKQRTPPPFERVDQSIIGGTLPPGFAQRLQQPLPRRIERGQN